MSTYSELKEKALAFNATQEDINALGEWFSRHGMSYWNGECFHVDSGHNLYPIHKEIGYDEYELVGYTFSSWDERIIPLPMTPEERAKWEAEEEERIHRENIEYMAEKKRKEDFFMKMPVGELVERYSIGFKRFHSPNESSIGIGKRQQAQEDGAENAIWRRRKSIKAFLLSKKEEKA